MKFSKKSRLLAFVIDECICGLPFAVFFLIGKYTDSVFFVLVGYFVFILGTLFKDALFPFQTPGKVIMGLKVETCTGSSLAGNYQKSFLRNFSLFIPFVDAVCVLNGKPRLGELWAGTVLLANDMR